MKCTLMIAGIIACLVVCQGQGLAQIYNQTCQSAEYARMLNRNAATDATDIIVYNPAGLTDLSEGLHLNVSNQVWFRRPNHTFSDPLGGMDLKYEQKATDWFVPNLHAACKKEDWALFGSIYIPGGGAAIDYPHGSFSTRALGAEIIGPDGPAYLYYRGLDSERIEASSLYLAASIGGAYKLSEKVSVALGIRTITVRNRIKGGLVLTDGFFGPLTPDVPLEVSVKEADTGWGLVAGIQLRLNEDLNAALHYESPVRLNLKTDIGSSDTISEEAGLFSDGQRNRRDFPPMIGIGVSYRFSPEFRAELDFNYWFQEASNWGRTPEGRKISDLAGDSFSFGAAAAYKVLPRLEISAGLLYTIYAWNDLDAYYNANLGAVEVFYSDDLMIGLGFAYEIKSKVKLNFGTGYIIYKDETIETAIGEVDIENTSSFALALGLDYGF
ncbi:MAG TPA: outer membrane beta-barrel protein [Deltaproteobacteria bacterium]|nr:outer membrane beta-barrel protein [Deltaproteobacteria bacterium]HPJ94980.1 outer membrane beta-barrel protein [Deltaproteobacteria bacterium]